MLKGILDKLFQTNEKQPSIKPISQEEVEALVDARLKEHSAALEKTIAEQIPVIKEPMFRRIIH